MRSFIIFIFVAIFFCAQSQSIAELRQKAIESYDSKDYKAAIKYYDLIAQLNPNDSMVYLDRALAKECIKDYESAIADYGLGIKVDPSNPDHYFLRGLLESSLKRYPEAIADYNKALSIETDNADAFYKRGQAKVALKQYVESIHDFDMAIKNFNSHAPAYLARGWVYAELGDFEKCLEDQLTGISLDTLLVASSNDAPEKLLNKCRKQAKKRSRKIDWKTATRFDQCNAGILDYYYQDYKSALKKFESALKLTPHYGLASFYSGLCLLKLNLDDQALSAFNKAISESPDCMVYRISRGRLYFSLGRVSDACADLKKYIELGGDPYEAHAIVDCK